jgi:hypothetical protein
MKTWGGGGLRQANYYAFIILALKYRGEWPASSPDYFTPHERSHLIAGWMLSRADLEAATNTKHLILSSLGLANGVFL